MKIFISEQYKAWDQFTMQKESISGLALMELAARQCFDVISKKYPGEKFAIFCGRGNNGGDGLALARMMLGNNLDVDVYLVSGRKGSADFEFNLHQFEQIKPVQEITAGSFPDISGRIAIDAIFGYGLNKPPKDGIAQIINFINRSAKKIISIDMPSGMFADKSSLGNLMIKSDLTLTFQQRKLAFYMPENGDFMGEVKVLDIHLSPEFSESTLTRWYEVDVDNVSSIYKPRGIFSNKGTFGSACIVAGSYGMMGAAVLSAHGCIRSGAGKVTCYTCTAGYEILQTTAPEALCKVFGEKHIEHMTEFSGFDAIGIGPGMGKFDSHKDLLATLFSACSAPIVIDADALNIMSEFQELYEKIPAHSIITPHPKEFERLFGKSKNDFLQHELALQKAKELNICIVLKGRYTFIATPAGEGFFNITGNAGMATGGTGDVLTGILTGLLAQGYTSVNACLLGVYLHGLAGDLAADELSEEALIAGDIPRFLGKAFKQVQKKKLSIIPF